MRRPSGSILIPVFAALLQLALLGDASAVINATTADDVCAPATDPCVITDTVVITPVGGSSAAVLDFGLRAVQITGSGQIDARDFFVIVRGGSLEIGGKGIIGVASGEGAIVELQASGRCSNDNNVPCLRDLTCGAGVCNAGAGTIDISTSITVNADEPGSVELNSVGDITIDAKIDVSGGGPDSDSGDIDVESLLGTVTVTGRLVAEGGGLGTGGDVTIGAGMDVLIEKDISLFGGDGDGGSVLLEAERDVVITGDINCNSASGGGSGGYVDVTAGRDIRIEGVSPTNRVTILADGHKDSDDFAGDGGDHSYGAARNIFVNEFVTITSTGASPDGFGGEIAFDSAGDLEIQGDLEARGKGRDGSGGAVDLFSSGSITVTGPAAFDITAGDGGGSLDATSLGPLSFGGLADVTAFTNAGFGGDAFLSSDDTLTIGGTLVTNGEGALFFATACRIHLTSTAYLNNLSEEGSNELEARESMVFDLGSRVEALDDGDNVVAFRTASKTPVPSPGVAPAPTLVERSGLDGCPVCGNAELDEGESCDDGNTTDSDGCASVCQLDSCIAQTPDFPTAPICDDGAPCTVDSCNQNSGNCDHVVDCDDGVSCTVDACIADECVSTPDNGRCNDGKFCNGEEICNAQLNCRAGTPPNCSDGVGCTSDTCSAQANACVNTPNDALCDDAVFCNGDEVCTPGVGCQGVGARDCDDGVACTEDSCSGVSDACVNTAFNDRCPDTDCTNGICVPGEGCDSSPNGLCSTTTTTFEIPLVCGDANRDGKVLSSDSLLILRTAVLLDTCDLRTCDVTGDGKVLAADALASLRLAVGFDDPTNCNFGGEPSGVARYVTTSTSTTSSTTMPAVPSTTVPDLAR